MPDGGACSSDPTCEDCPRWAGPGDPCPQTGAATIADAAGPARYVRPVRSAQLPGAIGDRRTVVALVAVVLLGAACGQSASPVANRPEPAPTTGAAADAASDQRPRGGEAAADVRPASDRPPPPPDTEVTFAFGGDLLVHLPIAALARVHGAAAGLAYDFGPMLAPMAPVLDGTDLALCHLEVPLAADGQPISGYPTFHAPRELATAVEGAGYDGCSTASNHSLDGGLAGIAATLDTFDVLGLGHAGTARSEQEASGPTFYEVAGARIAHLSYSYGFNGIPLPEGAPWAADQIDPERIAVDARAAKAFGAQLVVLSLHWGNEYQSDPSPDQQALALALAHVPEIDLIVGHHAHVVQPIEQVGDTWVVYGLGNQLANQPELPRRDGLTVVVTAGGPSGGPLEVRAVEAVPTFVDTTTFEVLPVAETLADPALTPERRSELEESARRTMEVVNRRGAAVPVYAWT